MKKKSGSLKRIIKLLGFLSIREGYLTLKNILGMIVHPYKTVSEIKKEKNYSQAIIIPSVVGLPFLVISFLVLAYLVFKHILGFYLPSVIGSGLKIIFILTTVYISATTIYISYWLIKTNKYGSHS
jgi:hypothetical protein